jgi:hypothetical protein
MQKLRSPAPLSALLCLAAASSGTAHAASRVHYVEGVRDAEDLVWLADTDWVIAGGLKPAGKAEPGHLFLINTASGKAEAVYPRQAANVPAAKPRAGCPAAPDPVNFEVHGLGLGRRSQGRYQLFAVAHAFAAGGREAIEVFTVDVSQGRPSITWTDCLIMPANTMANDVVALPAGGIAMTVFGDPADEDLLSKLQQGQDTGYVLEWHEGRGFTKVPGSEMSGANGIEVDADGKYLFVGAWGSKELIRLSRGRDPVERKAVSTGVLTDNSAWSKEGRLLVVGQNTTIKELVDCAASAQESCAAPFKVLAIDPLTLASTVLIDAANPQTFGGATAPLPVGNELWLGSFRGRRIARYVLQ